jgi:hydroxymethylpyrimidine pyrophosphatase-like HAD family hydrolase
MAKSDCRELFQYIHKNWNQVNEYWMNYSYQKSVGYKPKEHEAGDGSLDKLLDGLPEQLLKIVIVQPEEITPLIQKDLKEKFGERFRFDTSWANGLEIQSIDSGKGVAVAYMKNHMDIPIHTTVGIGDYENDISLLECADIGYAVGNALDIVKQVADRVTVSNRENAIAAVIKELEQEKNNKNINFKR